MQSGQFDKKVFVYRFQHTDDGFGGFDGIRNLIGEFWCNVRFVGGEIKDVFNKRDQNVVVELKMRKNAAKNILVGDIFYLNQFHAQFESSEYRINDKIEITNDFIVLFKGTKSV